MRRILHVVPTYLPAVRYGGPIHAVHGLCKGLVALGHEIHVFTTNVDGPDDSDVPLGSTVDLDGVQVCYFPTGALRRVYRSPAMGRALAREVKDFDLVHLHSVFLWPTWKAARTASSAGVPYVLSPRGMMVKDLINTKGQWRKSAWIDMIERRTIEAAAALHVTSRIEENELKKFCFNLPYIETVPNGVDEPRPFSESEVSQDVKAAIKNAPLILSLGRISWKKGLDRLPPALSRVPSGHLAIVGNDEEGLVPQLVKQTEALNIGDRVSFIPRAVHGADKEALFAAASLFVLPSRSENFGNVVLEAMIRGCPVVACREVGAAEVAVAAGAGIMSEGTPEDLATKFDQLLNSPDKARAMGEAGRQQTTARYKWSDIARQMSATYEAVTGAVQSH